MNNFSRNSSEVEGGQSLAGLKSLVLDTSLSYCLPVRPHYYTAKPHARIEVSRGYTLNTRDILENNSTASGLQVTRYGTTELSNRRLRK